MKPAGVSLYGALDLAGNAWERVNDWCQPNYHTVSPYANPPGPSSDTYKVIRGGSWNTFWIYLHLAYRLYNIPTSRSDNIGFRCAVSPAP